MKLKILFSLTILILFSSIVFSQAPPVPASLPTPDNYTSQSMDNNAFVYPDAYRVIARSSGVYVVTGSTVVIQKIIDIVSVYGSTIVVQKIIDLVNVTGSTVVVQKIIDNVNVTGSSITAVLSITNPIRVIESTGVITSIVNPVDVTGSSVTITNSPVYTTDKAYEGKVSTGTCGKITGATSGTVTVTDNVTGWYFKYRNLVNTETEATITSSLIGEAMYFYDGDSDSETKVEVPQAITFTISLPVEATIQYRIKSVK